MTAQTEAESVVIQRSSDEREIHSVLLSGGDEREESMDWEELLRTLMGIGNGADQKDCEVVLRVFERPRKGC